MTIWLPGDVADAIINETPDQKARSFSREIQRRLDPRLRCFYQSENVEELRAGFYYVGRQNDDGSVALWQLMDGQGHPKPPDESTVLALQKNDANRTDLTREWKRDQVEEAVRREKRAQDAREDAHGRFKEQADFTFRQSTPISKDVK